ncbi:MAG: hypothetical protein WCG93_04520 [Paludibacter sp.]
MDALLQNQYEYKRLKTRDVLLWPFSTTSIWNTPIGSAAKYVDAKLEKPEQGIITVDEDLIVLTPDAPLLEVYENNAKWDRTKDRCVKTGKLIGKYPIPTDFEVSPKTWDGVTPNSGIAILMADKKTIVQGQPYSFCPDNGYATMLKVSKYENDIYGDGSYGAHGGSKLSAIGGTLRNHELTPTSGPIRHALKINICGAKNMYYDTETKGFRWPAVSSDDYAGKKYATLRKSPIVKECRMGALMAIPPKINLDSLKFETVPARILGQAFQDFGAYIVDDSGWDVFAIETQWSPTGRFTDEFKKNWGFDFIVYKESTPWSRDIAKIYNALHVVDNNSANNIGGGGKRRAPLAPKSSVGGF